MRIAICDDRKVDADFIRELTHEWMISRQAFVQEEVFSSAESFLFRYAEEKTFDILLLDIEMRGMDGVTMAKQLRNQNKTVQIVFITGYSDYIAEGYEVEALHYLMKPVKKEKLFEVLDRAAEKIKSNEQMLTLNLGGEMVRIPIYEIAFADVNGNYVTIHAGKSYTAKMTLGKLEESLDKRFYRVGRSCIVNLTMISRVTKTAVVLRDGTSIPLPRGSYEGINRAIIQMG